MSRFNKREGLSVQEIVTAINGTAEDRQLELVSKILEFCIKEEAAYLANNDFPERHLLMGLLFQWHNQEIDKTKVLAAVQTAQEHFSTPETVSTRESVSWLTDDEYLMWRAVRSWLDYLTNENID